MDTLQAKRPSFTPEEAHNIVSQLYGLSGKLKSLPSERDQNFLFTTSTGEQFTLKFSNSAERRETLDLQHSAMHHIANHDATLRCPQPHLTQTGETITPVPSEAEAAVSAP
ncbi:MAG: hypothetical protein KC419_21220, partial [Anaerolineales bacterium]|nr:hypothetical protein [Anaerolineales bacterium]